MKSNEKLPQQDGKDSLKGRWDKAFSHSFGTPPAPRKGSEIIESPLVNTLRHKIKNLFNPAATNLSDAKIMELPTWITAETSIRDIAYL